MTTRTFGSLALVAALFVVGCGQVAGKPGGIPAQDAPLEIAKAVCPKAYGCCQPAQLMGNEQAGTDEPSCEDKTATAFRNQLEAVLASQKRFRSNYDGLKLEACLAHIRAATCEELGTTNHFSGIPGCDSFVEPRMNFGEACTHNWECVEGWCEPSTPGSDGACRPLSKEGESCETVKCLKGLVCDATAKTCAPPPAAPPPKGGACFYASACSAAGPARPTLVAVVLMLAGLAAAGFRRAAGTARSRRRSTATRSR